MAGDGNAPHVQHEDPPIFYCWKYWIKNGVWSEGCTPVDGSPQNFLDLNDYGWVYIVIPLIGLFLLVFIFYCFCRGKSRDMKRQPLMSEESESEDEEVYRSRVKSSAPYRGVPVRNADAKNYYTVVPIDPNDPRKMPLQGGVDPMQAGYAPQQRLYPRLTAMRHQAGINGRPKSVGANSHPKSVEAQETNPYAPDPTANGHAPKTSPKEETAVQKHNQPSSDESEEEQ